MKMRHVAASAVLLAVAASGAIQVPANMPAPEGPTVLPDTYRDELVVLTRRAPTTRFPTLEGNYAGLENDLAELFAQYLGVPVRFIEAYSYAEVLSRLERGEAHLAAASLVATRDQRANFVFGPGYMSVRQVLVRRRDVRSPKSLAALDAREVVVAAQSSGAELLESKLHQSPELNITVQRLAEPENVTQELAAGKAEFGVIGSHVYDLFRAALPQVRMAMTLGEPQKLAWAFPRQVDPGLLKESRRFFARIAADGTLNRLIDRYYGHVNRLGFDQISAFLDDCESLLPRYREHFLDAQADTGLDWRLIAALGYQESKWNPLAVSPTGVRGLMMLTNDTAERMGVRNKLDPRESILAGARYLKTLRDSLPARILEPDRTWLALAAYNQGRGHLEDARVLAQRLGLNPDVWIDVRRALPLLNDPEYYWELRYGQARGGEALALAENVRAFYRLLAQTMPDTPEPGLVEAADEPRGWRGPTNAEDAFLL